MNIKDLTFPETTKYLSNYNLHFSNIVDITKAGEGNMNITLRVKNEDGKTLILKQSPPYCEKYPSIPAPQERALSEAMFYQLANKKIQDNNYFPKVHHIDSENFILTMDDLGEANDYSYLYSGESIALQDLKIITTILSNLHNIEELKKSDLSNKKMRELNHQYIFIQPLENTDYQNLEAITPGLTKASDFIIKHNGFKGIVRELGRRYLEEGNRLCHGDFYPASWLKTDKGIYIIDPEFAFVGLAEFDYGVMLAHLFLSKQSNEAVNYMIEQYKAPENFNHKMALQFAGVEIMRRLLGVAQLPLKSDLKDKELLLEQSFNLVLKGEI